MRSTYVTCSFDFQQKNFRFASDLHKLWFCVVAYPSMLLCFLRSCSVVTLLDLFRNFLCVSHELFSCRPTCSFVLLASNLATPLQFVIFAKVTCDKSQLIQWSGVAREKIAVTVCLWSQSITSELCLNVIDHVSRVVWLFSLCREKARRRWHWSVISLWSWAACYSGSSYRSPASTDH